MKKSEKSGLSPVIATVLLISIVVVIGMIIFLWARGFVKEEGTKFGKNVKLSCPDVEFEATYKNDKLSIVNDGNVPVWKVNLKIYSDGSYRTKQLGATNGWGEFGIRQGQPYVSTGSLGFTSEDDRVLIIPVLLASSGSGQRIYTCEDQYGYELELN